MNIKDSEIYRLKKVNSIVIILLILSSQRSGKGVL